MERENMLGENTGLEQLNLVSKDVQASYIEEIGKIIPEVLIESPDENGKLKQSIDFDKLKGLLGGELSEQAESYEFTWVGKRGAVTEAGRPTTKTLMPDLEESVDFEKTENVFITGDNLEVLKILQESYLNKIDMIYIDPPYNTGKDFVYSDKFQKADESLKFDMDILDEAGRQVVGLTKNEKSSARYHSDWLNMIYPRLRLARNLLNETGLIAISIDDNEQANLKVLCDEIFGEENFIADMIWQSRTSISNDGEISWNHNHTLLYSKYRPSLIFGGDDIDESEYVNPDDDPRGAWKLVPLDANHVGGDTIYPVINPSTGQEFYPPNGRIWAYNRETMAKLMEDGRIKFGMNNNSAPKRKLYLKERIEKGDKKTPSSICLDAGTTKTGTSEVMDLFEGKKMFDYPKPVDFLKKLVKYGTVGDGLVLDFFAGSATTAEAVLRLNSEDKGSRNFILCTLDESLAKGSVAKLAGYETIDQISRERIRRAAEKIKKEHPDRAGVQDFGFKAFKVASSNYKNVAATPSETTQSNLFDSVSNIKPDRTPLDLLYQVILSWGIELSIKIESMQIESNTVYNVGDGLLLACFDEAISESTIRQMATQQPSMATFRDDAFGRSADKINLGEIFKELSPETKVKVI